MLKRRRKIDEYNSVYMVYWDHDFVVDDIHYEREQQRPRMGDDGIVRPATYLDNPYTGGFFTIKTAADEPMHYPIRTADPGYIHDYSADWDGPFIWRANARLDEDLYLQTGQQEYYFVGAGVNDEANNISF